MSHFEISDLLTLPRSAVEFPRIPTFVEATRAVNRIASERSTRYRFKRHAAERQVERVIPDDWVRRVVEFGSVISIRDEEKQDKRGKFLSRVLKMRIPGERVTADVCISLERQSQSADCFIINVVTAIDPLK
jgi:hypothetical protein